MLVVPRLVFAPVALAASCRVRRFLMASWLAVGLLVVGCAEEPVIRHYQVARVDQKPKPSADQAESAAPRPQRMIASIMPVGQQAWFVKGTGEPAAVAAQVGAWEAFLKSWKLDAANSSPAWELPAGWTARSSAGPMRFATLDAPGVEFSVTVLPMNSRSWDDYLVANVNRWRTQLQLPEASLEEIRSQVRQLQVSGQTITLVDLEGTSTGQSSMGPMAASSPPTGAAVDPHAGLPGFERSSPSNATAGPSAAGTNASNVAASGFQFDVPAGWQPGKGGPFRLAAFEIQSNGKKAEVTLSALGTQAGSVLENVNRWRSLNLGLGAIDDAQLAPLLSNVSIGDRSGQWVDLTRDDGEQGMFAVILPMDDRTIFAKILGDKALVVEQRGAFEQFVKSLRPSAP